MKTWKKPSNPQSSAQVAVRSDLSVLAASWRDLTAAERASWNGIVDQYPQTNRLGDTYTPSGYQLYMTLNSNLNAAGQSTIDAPANPVAPSGYLPSDLTMSLTAGVLTTGEIANSVAGDAGETIIVEMTSGLSAGINAPSRGLFKKVQTFAGNAGDLDIASAYQGLLGDPPLGTKVFARLSYVNNTTGQRTIAGTVSVIVAGT